MGLKPGIEETSRRKPSVSSIRGRDFGHCHLRGARKPQDQAQPGFGERRLEVRVSGLGLFGLLGFSASGLGFAELEARDQTPKGTGGCMLRTPESSALEFRRLGRVASRV